MAELREFTWEELKELNGKDDCHMLIHGKVYAIAPFLDEHPGGDEVLLGECGRDATEAFEDVGHSDEARDMLKSYLVGQGPVGTAPKVKKAQGIAATQSSTGSFNYLLPLAGIVAYVAYRYYAENIAVKV